MGATSSSCDKVTGQCLCRPNVGERQCDQCIDNFFQMTISGCQGKHILYDARLGVGECATACMSYYSAYGMIVLFRI